MYVNTLYQYVVKYWESCFGMHYKMDERIFVYSMCRGRDRSCLLDLRLHGDRSVLWVHSSCGLFCRSKRNIFITNVSEGGLQARSPTNAIPAVGMPGASLVEVQKIEFVEVTDFPQEEDFPLKTHVSQQTHITLRTPKYFGTERIA